jgi:16S rRNA A1518/A1519 N6-dimethyltransferase RsmA/KsgA/DIM1 with predicted DNA glycosylase/AP lyase activity
MIFVARMKFVPIDPPGQWCYYEAIYEVINKWGGGARTFIEVGVGAGVLSRQLCDRGYEGLGIEFSEEATALAQQAMADHLAAGRYHLIEDDRRKCAVPRRQPAGEAQRRDQEDAAVES